MVAMQCIDKYFTKRCFTCVSTNFSSMFSSSSFFVIYENIVIWLVRWDAKHKNAEGTDSSNKTLPLARPLPLDQLRGLVSRAHVAGRGVFSGAAAGGGVAAVAFLAILLSGGLQAPPQFASELQRPPPQFFAAEPGARHVEPEARPPPPPPQGPPAPPPEPPSSGPSASVLGAAAAVGAASVSEGGRLVHRRLRGKQAPSHRDVAVQTSPFELDATPTGSTGSTGPASVASCPGRVTKRHGR